MMVRLMVGIFCGFFFNTKEEEVEKRGDLYVRVRRSRESRPLFYFKFFMGFFLVFLRKITETKKLMVDKDRVA